MIDPVLAQQALGQQVVNAIVQGLALGAVYALLAVGFVMIFKATQVLNFAHGGFAAAGGMLTVYFATISDIPGRWIPDGTWAGDLIGWVGAFGLAIVVTGGIGWLMERLFVEPMVGEPLFSVAILTLGIDFFFRTIVNDFISIGISPVGDPWGLDGFTIPVGDGAVPVPYAQVATVVAAGLALLLLVWFFRSKLGVAMRATAFDQEAAMAQGIPVNRIFALAWVIGAGLAAVAGVFSSMPPRAQGVTAATGIIALRAFPAIIIGGLDSVVGSVIGAFMMGLAEVGVGVFMSGPSFAFLGNGFAGVVPYVLMLLVLVFKPYGLFGTEEIRRV